MGGAAFLRSVSVSSLLQGRATDHAPLVIIDSSANCQQAMESLAGSRILSAPLILRFGSKDAYQIIGWVRHCPHASLIARSSAGSLSACI